MLQMVLDARVFCVKLLSMNHIPHDFKMWSEPVRTLWRSLSDCRLCPRCCGVNHPAGDKDPLDASLRKKPTKHEVDYFRTWACENHLRLID